MNWGGAAQGAGLGMMFGPVGGLLGGAAGLLGLFGDEGDAGNKSNQSGSSGGSGGGSGSGGGTGGAFGSGDGSLGGTVNAQLMQQLTQPSDLGGILAANSGRKVRETAKMTMGALASNPNFSSNPSVQAALANQVQRTAQSGLVDANVAGAQFDQSNRQATLQAALGAGQLDIAGQELGLKREAAENAPTYLESLLGSVGSTAAGALLQKGISQL